MRPILFAAAILAVMCGQASAEPFPARALTLVVPFDAGGPTDTIARLVARSMSATLGQQIFVDNVVGTGGTIGAARVATAAPDGHTLLIAHVALPASAALYRSLPYDPATAFETVGLVNSGPMVLTMRPSRPATDAREVLAGLREGGGAIRFGHAGVGSTSFLCTLLLAQELGTRFAEATYSGTGPAMNDLAAGQNDFVCDQSTNAVPKIEAGAVKGVAVTSSRRLEVLRDLPTLQEAGLGRFELVVWHGLYVPRGTPPAVVTVLNKALRVALADAALRQRFLAVGTDVFPEAEQTPEAHRTRLLRDLDAWRGTLAAEGALRAN